MNFCNKVAISFESENNHPIILLETVLDNKYLPILTSSCSKYAKRFDKAYLQFNKLNGYIEIISLVNSNIIIINNKAKKS